MSNNPWKKPEDPDTESMWEEIVGGIAREQELRDSPAIGLRDLLRQVYHHPDAAGVRFSEYLMEHDIALAIKVSVAIGDIKP